MALGAYFRLMRAGWVLAREGALSIVDDTVMPSGLQLLIRTGRLN